MSTMKCFACPEEVNVSEMIKCVTCTCTYHFKCLNMSSSYFVEHYLNLKKTWRCPSCENVTSRRKGTDTPVRQRFVSSDSMARLDMSCDDLTANEEPAITEPGPKIREAIPQGTITFQQFAALLDSKLEYMKACLSTEIHNQLSSALEKLKSEFTATTEFLSGQISDLNKEVISYKNKFTYLENENVTLRKSINQLQVELNVREQSNLANDIQLTGIPEFENESLLHVVATVAAKIGVKIEERDIVSSVRVGPKRAAADSSSAAHSFRSRPIVVRLMRRTSREEFLKSARVRRGATTGDLGLPSHEPRRFYINERLTKTNRQIFIKARDAARVAKWRFVWTKEGRIYARRTESSEVLQLHTESDVDKLFSGAAISNSDPAFH